MLLGVQKKILSEEASTIFDTAVTPKQIQEFRKKCNGMGLELERDMGPTKSPLVSMFGMEIAPGIDRGNITVDSGGIRTLWGCPAGTGRTVSDDQPR